ncbi:hypothetical protein ACFZAM_02875 [Streptomyces sp. NPDC008079]|uniref:hypothetical protein n=1 Tax=Streptomyces sp. NPDC008079 TaxID=3364806 RepID=UPI0036F140E6
MSTTEQPSLFPSHDAPVVAPREVPTGGLRPAAARLVASRSPDRLDPEGRSLLFLVVDCPFCDHQHMHPGGYVGAPRVCPRRSRCIGRPGGAYYFPFPQGVPR